MNQKTDGMMRCIIMIQYELGPIEPSRDIELYDELNKLDEQVNLCIKLFNWTVKTFIK